jgi:hypothetical protein
VKFVVAILGKLWYNGLSDAMLVNVTLMKANSRRRFHMPVSILTAITNLVNEPIHELDAFYRSRNRANNMGEALEEYIKDAFAGTINEQNEQKRLARFGDVFSYLGNQNNPPDIMIRGGDAIEVKKIEKADASLALNSSYPKAKLFSDSKMITKACRTCENWTEKNIIFAVGVVNDNHLHKLYLVYGVDYAASADIYEHIRSTIRDGVQSIPNVEFAETKELGRVNRVDPLGITYLRIRGMWGIENPAKAFSYIYNGNPTADFELMAIINTEMYNAYTSDERVLFERLADDNCDFHIDDVKIKTPDNPVVLKSAKLISFSRNEVSK